MVLLMLMGVHLLVLLMLSVGVHLRVLRMGLVGVHFVVRLVLSMRVHFVVLLRVLLVGIHLMVLLVGLELVASGVGQHGLEQVGRLPGLVSGRVHEGRRRSLRLGMLLLLNLGGFPWVRDFRALLGLLLELHLGVRRYLRMRRHVLTV